MTLHLSTTKALSAAVAGAALIGLSYPAAVSAATQTTSSGLSNAQLTEMREEERMARDLYTQLAKSSGEAIFTQIATSEQRHLSAVERLMTAQGMDADAAGATVGRYAVPELQTAYDRWLAQGRLSDQAAYKVGVTLEKQDIADLTLMTAPSGSTAARVVQALLAGSEHHLAAFTKAVNGEPIGPGMEPGRRAGGAAGGSCPDGPQDGQRGHGGGRAGTGQRMGQGGQGMGWST
jgi:hypothetical protein